MYELRWNTVFRLADKATIPFDEGNRDYVAYLAWLAEGNTPTVVEEEWLLDSQSN